MVAACARFRAHHPLTPSSAEQGGGGGFSISGRSLQALPAVAAYWKEHYDLSAILQRDCATLGGKLHGKLHIYVGSADTYFLNDAVYYAVRGV